MPARAYDHRVSRGQRTREGVSMSAAEQFRLCVDRVIPDELNPARAMAERAAATTALRTRRDLPEIDASEIHHPVARMAIVPLKMWPNGTTLKCRFLDGDPLQRKRVQEKAHMWEQYANVTLKFVTSHDEQI